MKKLKTLSKAEMKEIGGGVKLGSYCGEGYVFARCRVPYQVTTPNPGGTWDGNIWVMNPPTTETHYANTGGCMPMTDYLAQQAYCIIVENGGPYPVAS